MSIFVSFCPHLSPYGKRGREEEKRKREREWEEQTKY